MCFSVLKNGRELTAKRNIKVYKILRKSGKALFYNLRYKPGEKQPEVKLEVEETFIFNANYTFYQIYKGYHSFTTRKKALRYLVRDLQYFYPKLKCSIAIFTIPKGAKYYINRFHGERVSSTIIFKEFLDKKED